MDRKGFLERADGVAFWLMMISCLALIAYSYISVQRVNYPLLFLLVSGIVVARVAWIVYAWRKPSIVEVEKAESLAFWTISFISLAVLTVKYVATNSFDNYIFLVPVAGLLTKYVMTILYVRASKAS